MLSYEKLKFIRQMKSITQTEMKNRIGCSLDMFKSMETGRRGIEQWYDKWVKALYMEI